MEQNTTEVRTETKKLLAKKDFHILCNDVDIKIKEGDDVNKLKLDKKFLENLKTEKVI